MNSPKTPSEWTAVVLVFCVGDHVKFTVEFVSSSQECKPSDSGSLATYFYDMGTDGETG